MVVVVAVRHVPETHDEGADGTAVDWAGGLLGALALAGLTFALIESVARRRVVVVGAWPSRSSRRVAFVAARAPRGLPACCRSRSSARAQFSAVNGVTFLVYGGFGVVFFLLVVQLQEAAGFGPVAAGSALLPVTALMLLLSARSGALAARIGPRLQMAVGPLVCAGGLLLLARVGAGDTYLPTCCPASSSSGSGLAVMVAPLTAAALARHPPSTPAWPRASTTRSPAPAGWSRWPRSRCSPGVGPTAPPRRLRARAVDLGRRSCGQRRRRRPDRAQRRARARRPRPRPTARPAQPACSHCGVGAPPLRHGVRPRGSTGRRAPGLIDGSG